MLLAASSFHPEKKPSLGLLKPPPYRNVVITSQATDLAETERALARPRNYFGLLNMLQSIKHLSYNKHGSIQGRPPAPLLKLMPMSAKEQRNVDRTPRSACFDASKQLFW